MDTKYCSIEDCQKPKARLGWCSMHYSRNRRYGSPHIVRTYSDPEEAFAARTEWRGDCLVWTGAKSKSGYGVLRVAGRTMYAHRFAYTKEHGVALESFEPIHHKCGNTICVNVEHLQAVTQHENTAEMLERRELRARIAELEKRLEER